MNAEARLAEQMADSKLDEYRDAVLASEASETDGYDSSARREELAASLTAPGVNADVVRTRILADQENAVHPRDAVRTAPGRAAPPGRPHRRKERIPPGPAALRAAAVLTGATEPATTVSGLAGG